MAQALARTRVLWAASVLPPSCPDPAPRDGQAPLPLSAQPLPHRAELTAAGTPPHGCPFHAELNAENRRPRKSHF